MQALDKQDDQIEELEEAAREMQQQLAAANQSVEQHASSMQKVSSPGIDSTTAHHRLTCMVS